MGLIEDSNSQVYNFIFDLSFVLLDSFAIIFIISNNFMLFLLVLNY